MARKVTFAEAELSVRRLFVGDREIDAPREPEDGTARTLESVIVQIKKVLAPELESILSSILGDDECLSLVLTPAYPRRRVSVWCADACILDASSVELLKKDLRMASDATSSNPMPSPNPEESGGRGEDTHPGAVAGKSERSKEVLSEHPSLEKLVSSFSHEVGNNLNAILMTAKLTALTLGREDSDIEGLRSRLETIARQAEVSGRILKTFSRLSKRWRVPPGNHDLDGIVRRWSEAREADSDGGRIDLRLGGDLPPLPIDPPSIEEIIDHLVRNAEAAQEAGESIEIRTEKRGNVARLSVRDHGPGIPPDHAGRIFEPFFSTRREEGAVGLGLTLVRHLVAEHGGTVEVTEAPGGGTTVLVELPLAEDGGKRP